MSYELSSVDIIIFKIVNWSTEWLVINILGIK